MTILAKAQSPKRQAWWGRLFGGLTRAAADTFLPPTCLACRVPIGIAGGLCPACWSKAGFIERPYCERLGTPFPVDHGGDLVSPAALADPPAYARSRAAARYSDVVRDLVHQMKYGDRMDLIPPLAGWMARAGGELLSEADLLIPVPLHWRRLWQRRFNQSSALAHAIGKRSGIAVDDHVLVRARATQPQFGLPRERRAENVQGAFQVPRERRLAVKGKKLVLIDDVLTTGATADACTKVLLRAGALRVDVLVLARVVDPN
ncbi:MAG TPA: ComF family protein [Xanthobacteraceae bacterium]|jgi:ComF family protein|nr:ComF family protein [Xanthobacteraceae bacterium]